MSTKRKEKRSYTMEYKEEAVKLACEIGKTKAAKELGIANSTLSQWLSDARLGKIKTDLQTPKMALTPSDEIKKLNAEIKALKKANNLLREENEFLEEASAFFAASRQKLAKTRE